MLLFIFRRLTTRLRKINRSHAKHLREFLPEFGDLPIAPMVATITRSNEAEAY